MLITIEYPETVTNIKDVRLAIEAGDKAGEELEAALDELDQNLAISTAAESGIARREAILGIKPLDTATLEDRRMEVLLKWFDSPIYTETTLRQKLDGAIGVGQYKLDIDLDQKLVSCRIIVMSKQILRIVRELFEKMIPLDYAILVLLWSVLDILLPVTPHYAADMAISTQIKVRAKENLGYARQSLGGVHLLDGSIRLNGYQESGAETFYNVNWGYTVPVQCQTACQASMEVRKNLWTLDGTATLGGTQTLNAERYSADL